VVPSHLQQKLLEYAHQFHQAHASTSRMYYWLRARFYFPRMKKLIYKFVAKCERCQKSRGRPKKFGFSRQLRASAPFHTVFVDFVGPLMLEGHSFSLLTMVDHFSGWPEVAICASQDHEEIIKAFWTLIASHGVPVKVCCDNAKPFLSKALQVFYQRLGIQKSPILPYAAFQNGCVERFNRTLTETIRTAQPKSLKDLMGLIPALLLMFRGSFQTGVNDSPFFCVERLRYEVTSGS
jgi:hypothetical protein